MKIRRHPNRPDWFRIGRIDGDDELISLLPGVPGLKQTPNGWELHRNILPLLGAALNDETPGADRWAARDIKYAAQGLKLRTTQQTGIDFIEQRRGTLIGDDMRLGKTGTALCSHDPSSGPMFIVAPLTARAVWLSWIKRVFPGVDVGVCTSKTFDGAILEKPIVFGHYDIIHKWQTLRPIGTLVLDEAHLLGSFKTHRNKAAALLASRAARVIALTGTPIWNMPEDLWSLVSLLAPGGWGSFYDFANRYAAPIGTAYGTRYTGASNQAELNARLTEIMLRRRWVDCCDDLPAISRSVLVADVDQKTSNKLDILAAKLKSERSNTAGHLAAYRRQVCAVKHRVVVEEARKIMSRGEPVVVWTWHREFAEQLAWSLGAGEPDPTAFLMHGDVAADKREAVMNAWRAKPCGVLVATMAVGQVAIDLSHAMFAIFAEIDFTPAIIAQAEMRTFMSTRPMNILFVVAAHIVDQRMVRALIAKLGAQDALGVGAACEAIDALRDAIMGPQEIGDLDRLLEAMLAAA